MRLAQAQRQKAMRLAFYDEFRSDIPVKHQVIVERVALFEDDGTPRTESTPNGMIGIRCG